MNSNGDMPIVDHLEEFRKRFFIVSVAHIIVLLLAFSQSGPILEKLMYLNPEMHLVFVEPSEIMLVYVQIAFIVSLVVCLPLTIYHIWGFIAKGLYENEKKLIKIALLLGFIFFILGVLFAYTMVIPMSLRFFTKIAIDQVDAMISIKSYVSFILTLLIAMGIVFNIPSFVYIATKLGLVNPSQLRAYEKHAIVIIFIVAAILTPPDIVSQCLMAIPMVVLLKIAIFVSDKVYKEKMKKESIS